MGKLGTTLYQPIYEINKETRLTEFEYLYIIILCIFLIYLTKC